jgi:transmembrane sensor
VRVQSAPDKPDAEAGDFERDIAIVPLLKAGQRAVVSVSATTPPQVSDLSGSEIAEALDWQAPRLQFLETPLALAIAEFNARNRTQLVLGQSGLGVIPIGGTFRVDNIDGFVRLLELTLDIRAGPRTGDEIVLVRSR